MYLLAHSGPSSGVAFSTWQATFIENASQLFMLIANPKEQENTIATAGVAKELSKIECDKPVTRTPAAATDAALLSRENLFEIFIT